MSADKADMGQADLDALARVQTFIQQEAGGLAPGFVQAFLTVLADDVGDVILELLRLPT